MRNVAVAFVLFLVLACATPALAAVTINTGDYVTLITGTQQFALEASGGSGTYTWALVSGTLPPGLALRTDVPSTFSSSQQAGLIGVATTAGTYNFTLSVTDGIIPTPVQQAFTVRVTALNIQDSADLPDAFVGASYSYSLTALNPAGATSYTHGTLPDGLSLSTAGVFSGMPTAAGVYHPSINLTDGADTITRFFNVNVYAVDITTPGALLNATQGASYNQTISASGGSGGYTFSVFGGLPNGLSLSSGGNLSGTVTAGPGTYGFQVLVGDSSFNFYVKQMSLNVIGAPPALPGISVGQVDDWVVGDSTECTAGVCCGGAAPFSWSVSGLPAGMSYRAGAANTSSFITPGFVELWGVPQATGNYTVQLTATDANSASTSQSFTVHVSALDQTPMPPGGTIGTAYSSALRILGGTGPYSVTQVSGAFPDGLVLNGGAMQISGAPLENGNYSPVLRFTDSATPANALLRTNGLNIANLAGTGINVNNIASFSNVATAQLGSPYSNQLSACCVAAYTWSVAGGALPAGITLSSGGLLSGTPTVAGTSMFLVKAADQSSVAHPGFQQFTLIVSPISITTGGLPYGTAGTAYSQTLAATGGTGTLVWTLNAGNYLPPGLSLSTAGAITGTPSSSGQYNFTVTVTDASANTASRGFNLDLYAAGGGPPVTIGNGSTATLTTGTQQFPLAASGGTGTYTWSLTSGTLPTGLAIRTDVPGYFFSNQQAGLIGVATTPGTYNFTLTASSGNQSTPQAFTIKITALNFKDSFQLPDAFNGVAYSYALSALNPAGPAAFTVSQGNSLPAGLSLSSAGVLSGTPTSPGQYNFGITLTDGTDTVTRGFNLNVSAVQITTAGLLPNGAAGASYNQTIAASGGSGGYTFNAFGGLPQGLSLSSGGTLSGTINTGSGVYYFQVQARDSSNNSYTKQMSLDVLGAGATLPGISPGHIDDVTVGNSYSIGIPVCCGGAAPFTWSVSGLPTGMTFRTGAGNTSSGISPGAVELWGIPQSAGNFTVQLTVTDANSASASQSFTLHVSPLDQNPQLPNGAIGTAYSSALRVLGGTGPYSATRTAGTLPDGLSINGGAMLVSGTPLETGNFFPTFHFTDSSTPANSLVRSNGFNIANLAGTSININNNSGLGTAQLGSPYSFQLNACCVSAYTWTVAGGSLPAGITLSTGGQLSGTPTAAGTFTFLIKAADQAAAANPGYEQFTLTVTPINITTNGLPYGNLTVAYSQTLAASGGTGTLVWSLNADNYLPPGLTLSSGGAITGTPTGAGQFNFNVTVTDANNNTAARGFGITVYVAGGGPPFSIVTAATQTLPTGTTQYPLTASGGTGTYSWSLTSGSLPPGLAIRTDVPSFFFSNQQAGLIGVATTTGTYNFTLTAASGSQSTPQAFTVKITGLNIKDLNQLPDSFAGSSYSYAFTALNPANSGANVSFTVSNGNSLPAGLSLSTAGVLSGTPTSSPGNYNFGVTLTDGVDTVSRNFNLNVSAVQVTTAGLLPNATQGVSYNQTIAASGGAGGYTFSAFGGMPNGFSLSSGGTLSGTTNNNSGSFKFQIQVRDSSNNSYTKNMSLDVIGTAPQLPEVSVPFIGDEVVGDPGSFSVQACCGGTAPFSSSVTGLPTGMSFRTGAANTSSNVSPGDVEIWGVPQVVGSYTVQLTLTDANSASTTQSFPFKVSALDQNPGLPGGTLGTAYSQPLRVLGGTGPYAVTQVGGAFPDGITLNAGAMTVGGTPLETGNGNFIFGPILRFTDSASPANVLVRTNGINISNLAGTSININNSSNLGVIAVGNSYSQQLNACCVSAYTWTVAGGALPTGLTLSTGGLLSGTPTASGTFLFLVKAADQAAVANPSYEQFTLIVTPIAITTNGLPYGNAGTSYSQTLAATGGTGTLTWSLNANNYLPPGLSLSSGGAITGTPTSAGQYSFTVAVTDANNNTNTRNYDMAIYVAGGGPPVSITTGATATLTIGTVQFALGASGGTGTYTWSLTSGSLPPGLALRTDTPSFFFSNQQAGLIGVATTTGTYNFTLTVASGNQSTPQAFTIKITALNIKDLNQLPDSFAGASYSYTLTALNPANSGANVSFTVSPGNPLPAGLSLSTAGILSGTPTSSAGNYNFGITLTDGVDTVSRNFTLNVSAVQITTAGQLPNATQGVAYNQTIAASGGSGGYTFSDLGGLPAGLSLSTAGVLSGTPVSGPTTPYGFTFKFQIKVTDSTNESYTKQMALTIRGTTPALPDISISRVDDAVIGDTFSISIPQCCGGAAPFGWSVTGLPTGMSFRTGSGVTSSNVSPGDVEIWGVPQAAGSYTVQFTLTDANSNSTSQSFTFKVSTLDQNPPLPGGVLGTAYSQSLRVLGGTGPYAVAQVGGAFPDGITLNAGAMTAGGTPLEAGNFGPVLRFTDSATPANVLARTNGMNVSNLAGASVNINSNSNLGTAQLGNSYSQQLSACCVSAYTWTVAGGALPTGISLSTAGLLSGTLTAAGTFAFLVKAADQAAVANPGYEQFTLTVTPISITTNGLPIGNLTTAYSQTLTATGGTGPLTWSLNANSLLPPGLTLSSAGVISGTPTSTGQYSFGVTVTDANNNTATRNFSISVYVAGGGPPLSVSPSSFYHLTMGTTQFALDASGGTGTYTWSVTSGTLPPGLALRTDVPSSFTASQQAGVLGVATTPGTYTFTLKVASGSQNVSRPTTLKVSSLNVQDVNLPDAFANTAYSYTFTVLNPGGTAGFGYNSLPAGLTLSSTGVLSGTPTVPGQYSISVNLANGTDPANRVFNLNVSAVQITTPGLLPNATQGAAYNQTISASGGSGGYSFSPFGGLPNGLSLNSSGAISGTINAGPGVYAFGVTVRDSSNNSYTKQMSINVAGTAPALPEISLGHVDDAVVGDPDSFSVSTCCGGTAPFAWSVTGLPTGMSYRTGSGVTSSTISPGNLEIWGIPQAAGNYTVQLTLTDANSLTASQSFTFHVSTLDQNPTLPGGTLGASYSQSLRILGGTGPYSVTQTGNRFPDGLTLNASALTVAGTPLESGNFGPVLSFTDSSTPANTLVRTNGMNISNLAGTSININTSSTLPTAILGSSYSQQLNACCVSAYTWTVAGGALPTGIALSTAGVLSGTPTASGTFTFLVKAADQAAVANPGYEQFTLTVTPIAITTNGLPYGNLTIAYSQTLAASGGTGTLVWTLATNNLLPPGLALSSAGVISGTPTSTGQYGFSVTVTDANNNTASRNFSISVYSAIGAPPLIVSTGANITLTTGAEQFPLSASGGTGTYTWSLTSGSLPTGLALRTDVPSSFGSNQQAGLIGVATTPGTYNFTLTVTSGSQSTPQALSIRITALNFKDSVVPDAFAGAPYSFTLSAVGNAGPVTFAVTGGGAGLSGMSLSGAGVISGTPTPAGSYGFTLSLTDGTDTVFRTFNFPVYAVDITTPGLLPNGTQNASYNQTIAASGGSGGYTFTQSGGGNLPNGLTLSTGGTISGTINAGPGRYVFTVSVTDSSSNAYARQMAIDVVGASPSLTEITLGEIDDATIGNFYSTIVGTCCGGVAPLVWTASGLPAGMSVRSATGGPKYSSAPGDAEIWGVPQASGAFTVQLTATDANGAATTLSFPFHVSVLDQRPSLPNATLNTAYAGPLRILGGTGPYAATQATGVGGMPDGLALGASPLQISGTPLENGGFNPVLRFTDSSTPANTLLRGENITVNNLGGPAITISGYDLGLAMQGSSYSAQLFACCVSAYTWSVAGGALPAGITLTSGGLLSGTPTVAGNYIFLVEAADQAASAHPGYRQFKLTVTPIAITTAAYLPAATVGVSYDQALTATGGTGTLTWGLQAFNYLPPGLTLGTDGTLSGTPTSAGQYSFVAFVQDSNSNLGGTQLTLNINPAGSSLTSQTITFNSLSNVTYGASPFTISATASSGLTVAFSSTTTSVCSVSGTTVTILAGGPCSITASQSGNTTYAAATPVPQGFTVNPATQTIAFGSLNAVAPGAPAFNVSANSSSGLAVTFSTVTTTVCSVSGNTVTILAIGSCSIAANQSGNADYSAAQTVTQTFTVTANTLTAGSASAAPGSSFAIPSAVCSYNTQCFVVAPGAFKIPITLNLTGGATIDSLTFGVQIAPNAGAPVLTGALGFTKASAIADTPFINGAGTANSVGVVWGSLTTPLTGAPALGFVTGTLPATAIPGQTYTVTVTGASAALSSASVPVGPGASSGITVGNVYMMGDVAPKPSDTAPNFGDGVLNILDLIQELFAVNNISGFVPAACSDRLDAMDLFPADTATARGGDGVLDIRDLILELFRVNNLDTSRPVRASRSGCAASGSSSQNSETSSEPARALASAPKPESAIEGELVLGPAESTSPTEDRVPIYLEARQDLVNIAVTFAIGDQHSQLRFLPTLQTPPSFANDSQLGVVAGAWLQGINVKAGNRLLLGYVAGPAAAMANLKVFGLSAAGLVDNREVRLAPPAGPASQ